MPGVSQQREHHNDALALSREASTSLTPLHDDLAELSPSFDGTVYFAKDRWHKNNASAVATVQPESGDVDRFAFYKENIAFHRVDLGATALGEGLQLAEPALLRSRMNPDRHTTWAHRAVVDGTLAGGLQVAFNSHYGPVPSSSEIINKVWDKHEGTVLDVADAFHTFSKRVGSIGDTLELQAPATPNAYILSWDLRNSTVTALAKYGALRNYLLDTKHTFADYTAPLDTYVHDTGDGQDIALWLPETSEVFDRADKTSIRGFGTANVLPLIDTLLRVHGDIADAYPDLDPRINFVVGLGYVEHDRYDGRTSREYWENARALKDHPVETVSFTQNAQHVLFPTDK